MYKGDPRSNANTSFVMNADPARKFNQLISLYMCTMHV